MHTFDLPTPYGVFRATFSELGLARLEFPDSSRRPKPNEVVSLDFNAAPLGDWMNATAAALRQTLAGRNPELFPPLDWSRGTEFQRNVWQALRAIEAGQTRTYSEIAAAIGRPRATRAVGLACGANPIPVLVPCHRVLAAGGRLGGFSAGLDWKRRLLAAEGVIPWELMG